MPKVTKQIHGISIVCLQSPYYLKQHYIASAILSWNITFIVTSSTVSNPLFITTQIISVFWLCFSKNLEQHTAQAKQKLQNFIFWQSLFIQVWPHDKIEKMRKYFVGTSEKSFLMFWISKSKITLLPLVKLSDLAN